MQPPSAPVRICCAQISSVWEEPEKTLEKAAVFIRHAAASGASLICFPEQFATGWDPESGRNIQDIRGNIVSRLRELAGQNRICILGSFRQGGSGKPRNTAIVIDREGGISAMYSKIHLFSPAHEEAGYDPGNELGLFTLGPLCCGMAICYDLRFPELFRLYARGGAHVVFVVAAWPAQRQNHWELFITARAAENQMYVVGVNTTGTNPVDMYTGGSMAADPRGSVITRANDAEQLLFIDVDPSVVDSTRRQFPVEKDRKETLYRSLSRDTSAR
ncbi:MULTISPECIES: nitrilase-related carbon-nitrogen hydrolase [unclassified Methanoregula]|uniref:nitrilase-related carbon-nitrogen hydrolase n=1 Tax=unclassified Methanoregula TaxID=2649730 RepID=UPI0009CFA89E|nr:MULTISPECIES: nitrilase-related carbon-nitrogen hydrolase [unclassified Methanoregula]OPX61979.1 MAG: C-N hydrolase family amidase [Methanoregula sp. PtaB.Bin085]OPY34346.1 MAG: C-N hydrolase family amidase [Methanoregula sp. PtaU1.Bin006]